MCQENSDLSLLVQNAVIRRRFCLWDRLNHLLLGKGMRRAGKLSSVSMSETETEPQSLAAFFSRKPARRRIAISFKTSSFFSRSLITPPQIQLAVVLQPMPNSAVWHAGSGRGAALQTCKRQDGHGRADVSLIREA